MPSDTTTLSTDLVAKRRLGPTRPAARVEVERSTIWIDLDNSPHVPLFAPIIQELQRLGHKVLVTARDCFQVCELASLLGVECKVIGRHYGGHKLLKLAGLGIRAAELTPSVWRERPQLAISHGSRAQLLLCAALRIPSIVMVDYEFASGLTALKPSWIMAPEAIPPAAFNFDNTRVLGYPGIKEDIYVPRFSIDSSIRRGLGLADNDLVITIRPPANEAHYHNPESDVLFHHVIDLLASKPDAQIVLLPRNERQGDSIRKTWPALFETKKIRIPTHAVEGLNLIWASDLVISGGGTMNREAAALGVPVYSIFRGKIGAVDRYLAETGRMVLIEKVEDIPAKLTLRKRSRTSEHQSGNDATLGFVIGTVQGILADLSPRRKQVAYGH